MRSMLATHNANIKKRMADLMATKKPNEKDMCDDINHPKHYIQNGIEVITIIEAFGLDKKSHLANVIKYVLRSASKGKELEDLKKAQWYLNRYITQLLDTRKMKPKEMTVRNLQKENSKLKDIIEDLESTVQQLTEALYIRNSS